MIRWLTCLILLFSNSIAADDAHSEYKIKAGYLYNFTKFITWSEINNTTFNLCILGTDPFGPLIDPIEEKFAFAKPIRLIRLDETNYLTKQYLNINCPILYIGGVHEKKAIFEKLHISPQKTQTLVVGESSSFAEQKGMINFINRNGNIKLQINLQSLQQTGLKISAKLLEIAEIIKDLRHD